MARIVCFANQKGGVGKTTTCVNLCAAVQNRKHTVLLVDTDPQGNAATGMGVDKNSEPSLYDILINQVPAEEAIQTTPYGDVIPSNLSLSGASVELVDAPEREYVLKKALAGLQDRYDYIFIDCPPSLGLLTINAFAAADGVLVPVQCEYYAMEGLADLVTSIQLTRRAYNPGLEIEGILLTMYDKRLSFSGQVAEEIRKYFSDAVYKTEIPRNVRIAEAPSHGKPVRAYNRISKGAAAYDNLAEEFLRHDHSMTL